MIKAGKPYQLQVSLIYKHMMVLNLIISLVPSQGARGRLRAWAFYKMVTGWNDDALTEISQVALFRTRIFLSLSPPTSLSLVSAHGSYLRRSVTPSTHGHPSWQALLVSLSLSMHCYFNHFPAYPISSFKNIHSFSICNLCSWEHSCKQTKSKQILMDFIAISYDMSVLLNMLPIRAIKSSYVWKQHVE